MKPIIDIAIPWAPSASAEPEMRDPDPLTAECASEVGSTIVSTTTLEAIHAARGGKSIFERVELQRAQPPIKESGETRRPKQEQRDSAGITPLYASGEDPQNPQESKRVALDVPGFAPAHKLLFVTCAGTIALIGALVVLADGENRDSWSQEARTSSPTRLKSPSVEPAASALAGPDRRGEPRAASASPEVPQVDQEKVAGNLSLHPDEKSPVIPAVGTRTGESASAPHTQVPVPAEQEGRESHSVSEDKAINAGVPIEAPPFSELQQEKESERTPAPEESPLKSEPHPLEESVAASNPAPAVQPSPEVEADDRRVIDDSFFSKASENQPLQPPLTDNRDSQQPDSSSAVINMISEAPLADAIVPVPASARRPADPSPKPPLQTRSGECRPELQALNLCGRVNPTR